MCVFIGSIRLKCFLLYLGCSGYLAKLEKLNCWHSFWDNAVSKMGPRLPGSHNTPCLLQLLHLLHCIILFCVSVCVPYRKVSSLRGSGQCITQESITSPCKNSYSLYTILYSFIVVSLKGGSFPQSNHILKWRRILIKLSSDEVRGMNCPGGNKRHWEWRQQHWYTVQRQDQESPRTNQVRGLAWWLVCLELRAYLR